MLILLSVPLTREVAGSNFFFYDMLPVTNFLWKSLYIQRDPCAVTCPCAIIRKEVCLPAFLTGRLTSQLILFHEEICSLCTVDHTFSKS